MREYLWLILLGFLISTPVAYFLINGWLDTFAYRIDFSPEILAFPLVGVILMTLISVGSISYKAALQNPVDVLKEV